MGWFQRYKQLEGFAKQKQRKFFLLIGSISKSIIVSSDSFCLITSQIFTPNNLNKKDTEK